MCGCGLRDYPASTMEHVTRPLYLATMSISMTKYVCVYVGRQATSLTTYMYVVHCVCTGNYVVAKLITAGHNMDTPTACSVLNGAQHKLATQSSIR